MTQEQFDNQRFGAKMICIYKGKQYDIVSVDFEERTIGISEFGDNEDDIRWKRCENIELV